MSEHLPTIKEQILASLLAAGPATREELVARLAQNSNSVRRELADMVRREDVVAVPIHSGVVGRAAYHYRHPETEPAPAPIKGPTIRPSRPEAEAASQPVEFGGTIPAHALQWNPEYQRLWRNGL